MTYRRRRHWRELPEHRLQDLVADLRRDMRTTEAARRHDVRDFDLAQLRRAHGIKSPATRKLTDAQELELFWMAQADGVKRAAARFGVSERTGYNAVRRHLQGKSLAWCRLPLETQAAAEQGIKERRDPYELGRALSVDHQMIRTHAGRMNLPYGRPVNARYDLRPIADEVVRLYIVDERPAGKVAKQFGISAAQILQLVVDAGHRPRNAAEAKREYPLREDAFDELSSEGCYWLGWLASDGHVSNRVVGLTVQHDDAEILRRFLAFLGCPERPISRGTKGSSSVAVTSARLVERLQELGIGERKSLNIRVAEPLAQSVDFWRGEFDGDGCCTIINRSRNPSRAPYWPQISFLGSRPLMDQCAAFWAAQDFSTRVEGKGSVWQARFSGSVAAEVAAHLQSVDYPTLERKSALLDKAVSYRDRRRQRRARESVQAR